MHLHHLLYLDGFLGVTYAAFAPCYAPDGTPSPGTGYLPCVSTSNVDSMCCVLNSTALTLAGETIGDADTCLPNGLCLEVSETTRRAFCTDKTWKSPNCLGVCTGGASGGNASIDVTLTHCSDGSWCCGTNNLTSCCDLNLGFQIPATIPPYAASATAAFTATAVVTVTSIATSSAGPSNVNSLGIGLGVTLGVVLIAASIMGFLLFRRHRVQSQVDEHRPPGTLLLNYNASKSELEQPNRRHEVPSWREPVEMYGGSEGQ